MVKMFSNYQISMDDIFTCKNIVFLQVKIYGFSQWQKY